MKKILVIFLLGFLLTNLNAQRGRVQVQNGTLVTDQGTLLRGIYVALDNSSDDMPQRDMIPMIRDLGLNTIHLYAENFWDPNQTNPGYNIDKVDSLVKWTASDSLYMIITFAGGFDMEADSIIDFMKACWEIYAERYKDETHLVFEIYNEPGNVPYDSLLLVLEKDLYKLIRSHAPETHILLMTPYRLYDEFLSDLSLISDSIDWNNASIAAHAYNWPSVDYINYIRDIKNAGYVLTFTEFYTSLQIYANLALIRAFEQESVSYCHFIEISKVISNNRLLKDRIESGEVRWTPDFGSWPENVFSINYISPYELRNVGFYDEGFGFNMNLDDSDIDYLSDDGYIAFYNLDFSEPPGTIEINCASDGYDGIIDVHLDSLSGPVISSVNTSGTGGWDTFEWFSSEVTDTFTGVHKIYLEFTDRAYNIKAIRFIRNTELIGQVPVSEPGFYLFPNPANDNLTIQSTEEGSIEIYSMQGKLLLTEEISNEEQTISINPLKTGNYVVKLVSQNEIHAEILIVK